MDFMNKLGGLMGGFCDQLRQELEKASRLG